MNNQIEAMKQALEALDGLSEPYYVLKAQAALRQAIAQAEKQEPVAWNENIDEMPFNTYCKAVVDWYSYATNGDSFLEGRDVEVIVVRYKVDEDEDDIVFMHKGNKQYAHTKCEVSKWKPLYTAPPRKEWVGLTDDEIRGIFDCGRGRGGLIDIKKAEQILKEKNDGSV